MRRWDSKRPPGLWNRGQILADLGIRKMKLMTNNPRKIIGLEGYGLTVVDRVPLAVPANEINLRYLRTKCAKLGHMLEV